MILSHTVSVKIGPGRLVNRCQHLDFTSDAGLYLEFPVVDRLSALGEDEVVPLGQDRSGKSPDIGENRFAFRRLDRPLDVRDGLPAGLRDKFERHLGRAVIERCVGQLAWLHTQIRSDHCVDVTKMGDHVVGAGIEGNDVVGRQPLRHDRSIPRAPDVKYRTATG